MTTQTNAARLRRVFGRTPYRLTPVVLRMWPQCNKAQVVLNGKQFYVELSDMQENKALESAFSEFGRKK